MDAKLVRIAVGFALESAIVYKRDVEALVQLYSNPDIGRIREIHDRLIASRDHLDRAVAIWLEPALEQGRLISDPQGLAREMREMEYVLNILINRSVRAQGEVNDWMNYIANAAQFIVDGFWIDAKILLSRALHVSRTEAVEGLKSVPGISYEVDVLQRATESYFEEIKTYPIRFSVPNERLDTVLTVQGILLELMQSRHSVEQGDEIRSTVETIHRLSSAVRYLMEEKGLESARKDLNLALNYLKGGLDVVSDEANREIMNAYSLQIEKAISMIESQQTSKSL